MINPQTLNYLSNCTDKSVTIDYKYNLLKDKYAKKEIQNGLKVLAIKVTNNSGRDLVFGKDIKLVYGNGNEITIIETDQVFQLLKQHPASYLWYLLLTPARFTTSSNGQQTNSIPIGYALGPGITAGNMIAASSANDSFKKELIKYNIIGTTIKSGDIVYSLVGINSNSFENIKVKVL
jgi:hypothetical protein